MCGFIFSKSVETFAVLIALIFIEDSFSKLTSINIKYKFSSNPVIYFYKYVTPNCTGCVNKEKIEFDKEIFLDNNVFFYNQTEVIICEIIFSSFFYDFSLFDKKKVSTSESET